MIEAALVLEGGALRSLYTAGVLDMFMEKNIEFSCVIGVSAGALTAANYISKQKYRSAKINILWNCQGMCSQRIPKILDRQISGSVMSQPC